MHSLRPLDVIVYDAEILPAKGTPQKLTFFLNGLSEQMQYADIAKNESHTNLMRHFRWKPGCGPIDIPKEKVVEVFEKTGVLSFLDMSKCGSEDQEDIGVRMALQFHCTHIELRFDNELSLADMKEIFLETEQRRIKGETVLVGPVFTLRLDDLIWCTLPLNKVPMTQENMQLGVLSFGRALRIERMQEIKIDIEWPRPPRVTKDVLLMPILRGKMWSPL